MGMSAPKYLRPFWRYYGGKWRSAPRYPGPVFDTVVEPFAGAAGYACRHYRRDVVLVDRSPIIAGIWRYLIAESAESILALPDIPEGGTVDDMDAPQEARWLAGFWCDNGVAAPRKSPSKWAREHGAEATSWSGWSWKVRQRVASQVDHIRHWRVIEGEYHDAPDVMGTWFVDPPYSTPAGMCYKEQPESFAALGEWCRSRQGQVIVCEQEGADWLPFEPHHSARSLPSPNRPKRSAEVAWFQGPQTEQEGLF